MSQPPSQLYIGARNVVYQCRYFCHLETNFLDKVPEVAIAIQATDAGWVTSGLRCHRSTARPCSEVEPKLPPAAPAEQLFQASSELARISSLSEIFASKVPEAKAKAGKARPVPARLSLQDCYGMLQDIWSQQILGIGVHLQAFAGWTSSFSSRLCRATALGTFLKSNAVYEIYHQWLNVCGSTRCRHPHTNTV